MIASVKPKPTLEEFLKLSETEPASEFLDGEIIQKPTPQGEHSVLQWELCKTIDQVTKTQKTARAFPELYCTFGGASIVPDVAVFRWKKIPFLPSGKIANRFEINPDWSIEILSPNQSQTKVLSKFLHCSGHGTELGWLLDPEEESILAVFPGQKVELYKGASLLLIIDKIELELTVDTVFSWLSFGG
ncbi:Uma2 family endonuclease [Microcoleus sp. Pol12B4]|uniref:Uma2 family endonuclease n=1 Tax=Microcoleus sp. Pol12B4 TaxID=3055395 RepID=UPI002FD70C40